ncbi:MAG TPA: permease-like cell division protein FtsX [Steroidobacteraceae bacterium]|nr:permease-like cell division protein FtsX [Steroidobacteraceae bacterium]
MSAPSVWLTRHAQTFVGSLGRLAQQPAATAMTMAVVAVALALPLFLNVLLQNTRLATEQWNQAFDLSVYLGRSVGAERAQAIAKQLRTRADVAQVRLIPPDEALATFRTASGFGKALDALGDNPLPTTLIVTPTVTASTPDGTQALQAQIAALRDVDLVQLDTEWVQRLDALLEVFRRILWLTAALLGVGVVVIVGNTIRLDILNRKAEIEVMKLVGATDGFARRPFLYSGLWYGLGGGLGAILVVGLAVALLAGPVERLAGLYGSRFELRGLGWTSTLPVLGAALGLSWLGSWIAASRHIRAVRPS